MARRTFDSNNNLRASSIADSTTLTLTQTHDSGLRDIIYDTAGLVAYWPGNEPSGSTALKDHSTNANTANAIGASVFCGYDGVGFEKQGAFGASRQDNYFTTNTQVTAPWIAAYSVAK